MPFGDIFQGFAIEWLELGKTLLQLSILMTIVYLFYSRFIRKSQAEQLLKGLFIILMFFVGLWGLARVLSFTMLETVFGVSIQLLIIGLIVIFQPELRRMLIYLGQPEFLGRQALAKSTEERQAEYLVKELTEAVRFLSKSKTGALIVLESANNPEDSYLEAGTSIDAAVSTELLLTIFHPNTPLHDGALVINAQNRLIAAGVLLPLTEDPKLSWQYGTRHRAAIGLTELTDSHCIVVSEETGSISFAEAGHLEKLGGADELQKRLERLYHITPSSAESKNKKSQAGHRFRGLFSNDVPNRLQKIMRHPWRNTNLGTSSKKAPLPPSPKSGKSGNAAM